VSVTGAQAKLSVDLDNLNRSRRRARFTLVGLWGNYILKPPSEQYESLPELEDLTMHLAEVFGIRTVPHSLIRLRSGELAYITRRVDRVEGRKLAMEDMCQLTEKLTEDKYKGSMEQVGRIIRKFSDNSGFDALEFLELAVFSFLAGNADMHLKNFSLIRSTEGTVSLAPAHDLIATKLAIPQDTEEMALTINGKKSNLRKADFGILGENLGINEKVVANSFSQFSEAFPGAVAFVGRSFLNERLRDAYASLLAERGGRLGIASS